MVDDLIEFVGKLVVLIFKLVYFYVASTTVLVMIADVELRFFDCVHKFAVAE